MYKSLITFRGTTILKAFIINSIIIGIVAALTIETRQLLNNIRFKNILSQSYHKVLITMIVSTLVSIVTLIVMRLLLGTYAGMLDGKRIKSFL